jgi:hypothetical protein
MRSTQRPQLRRLSYGRATSSNGILKEKNTAATRKVCASGSCFDSELGAIHLSGTGVFCGYAERGK